MSHRREGLLAQIEAGVLDDSVPVSSLLQKCIVLGGQAGSEKLRAWARQELNGYGADPIPDYRRIRTGLAATVTNHAGYNPMTHLINLSAVHPRFRNFLSEEGVDLEVAVLGNGIGELEALANRSETEHQLMPPWAGALTDLLNHCNTAPNSRVQVVYWPLSDASRATAAGSVRRWCRVTAAVIAFLIGLAAAECTEISPVLARRLVRWAAFRWSPDAEVAAAYAEEWLAVIDDRPGKPLRLPVAPSGALYLAASRRSGEGSRPYCAWSQARKNLSRRSRL